MVNAAGFVCSSSQRVRERDVEAEFFSVVLGLFQMQFSDLIFRRGPLSNPNVSNSSMDASIRLLYSRDATCK